jgi:hypothetical protein
MRPVDTIPGMGRGEIKENGGGGVNLTMIYCKNLNVTVCPQYNNNMIIFLKSNQVPVPPACNPSYLRG